MELHVVSTGNQTAEKILSLSRQIYTQVTAIHIREKQWSDDQVYELVQAMRKEGIPAAAIRLNSRIELAAELQLGGAHLPEHQNLSQFRSQPEKQNTKTALGSYKIDIGADRQSPKCAEVAEEPDFATDYWQGNSFLLGRSVHSIAQAVQAEREGMDYLFYGHIYETASKPGVAARGLEQLKQICAAVDIPVIAIGGIQPHHAEELISAGAAGIAVMSGIFAAEHPAQQVAAYKAALSAAESSRISKNGSGRQEML
ncbi:thiamine phosphate synthase [Paenibacillus shenyangensis]|uniref:thiamine phosphate synthase n=1 Tax=Paenibacillus sp. A9 TaxID=1284352 RepID=UPI000372FB92|nr:thiamine phosphate synthase [Paenibacillus sp. A9]